MKVGCYIRVSTQEQAKEGYSISAQTERLKAYCIARGWSVYEIYTDPGYSGAKVERPALQNLIMDAKSKKIDLVLVYKLDRLSRSQKDTLYLIEDVFIKNDVDFVSINENFDTSTAFGRAMIGILSVFAQLEREQIKERTQMGKKERAKDGLWKGGGTVPIGYEYVKATKRIIVNDYEAGQVKEVFNMFVNQGFSISKIQERMQSSGYHYKSGSWGFTSTVKTVLLNPVYVGIIQWNGEQYIGQHEAIISSEQFEAAQVRLSTISENMKNAYPFQASQLLTGALFCNYCGARYFAQTGYRGSHKLPNSQRKPIHTYVCYSRARSKKEMVKDSNCKNKRWPSEQLDSVVLSEIRKLASDSSYFDSFFNVPNIETGEKIKQAAVKKRIVDLDARIIKMLELYQFNNIPTDKIAQILEQLTDEKNKLCLSLSTHVQAKPDISHEEAKEIIDSAITVLERGEFNEVRKLIFLLIKRIDIDGDKVYITWKFL